MGQSEEEKIFFFCETVTTNGVKCKNIRLSVQFGSTFCAFILMLCLVWVFYFILFFILLLNYSLILYIPNHRVGPNHIRAKPQ